MQKPSCCSLRGSVIKNRVAFLCKGAGRQQRSSFRRQQMTLEAHGRAWVALVSLLTGAHRFTADENQVEENEKTEDEIYVKLTRCISHLRGF